MLSAKSKAEVERFFGRSVINPSEADRRRALRIRILQALATGHSAPRELHDALVDVEVGEVNRTLRALVRLGAVRWNGLRGSRSRYYRLSA